MLIRVVIDDLIAVSEDLATNTTNKQRDYLD